MLLNLYQGIYKVVKHLKSVIFGVFLNRTTFSLIPRCKFLKFLLPSLVPCYSDDTSSNF